MPAPFPFAGTRIALIAAAILAFACPLAAHAQVNARCELGNSNGETFKGPCIFTLGAKGSFSVARPGNALIIADDVLVLVRVTGPGAADVTSRTRAGVMLNWGRAARGANGSACWRGADFWICVYALSAPPASGAAFAPPSRF